MRAGSRSLSLAIFLWWVSVANVQAQDIKVLTGATLIDGTGRAPIKEAVIVIEGTRIKQVGVRKKTKIPKDAMLIDGRGKFIIPGLADMHNHILDGTFSFGRQDLKKNLTRLLAFGITTIFDPSIGLKDFVDLKAVTAEDIASYPRFFAVGPIISVKGGSLSGESRAPETADEARAVVKELKAASVDAIKLSNDDLSWCMKRPSPLMKPEVVTALIEEAHQQGLKAYVHAPMLKPAKEVLRAGADGLVHGIIDEPIDEEFIALMKKNRAVYISTLSLFEAVADIAAWARRQSAYDECGVHSPAVYDTFTNPFGVRRWEAFLSNTAFTKEHLPILRSNLKKVFEASVPIVVGTDTGFFGVLLGVASHLELVLHVEAGLKPGEGIRAATINAARMMDREKEVGTVEKGKLADLVILDANPLDDIRNVRKVYAVMKGGNLWRPADLLQKK